MSMQSWYENLNPYEPPYHYPRRRLTEEEAEFEEQPFEEDLDEEIEDEELPLTGANMSTEIAVQTTKGITNDLSGLSNEKIELLKRTFCKDLTNDELELFIHVCKKTGLDPFIKQIYAVKRGGVMTIQTSIDGLRLIADRTKSYSPGREPSFTYTKENSLVSATAYIKKRTSDGVWHEISSTAFFNEYKPSYKNNFWSDKPHIMLAKCAEAMALRRAFPAEMTGLYSDDEMHQAQAEKMNANQAQETIDLSHDYNITESQAEEIISLIGEDIHLQERILLHHKVESIHHLKSKDFKFILNNLKQAKILFQKESKNKEMSA